MVSLITFRDELRARLRQSWPAGVPVLTEAVAMIASYLTAEQAPGRIAPDAEVDVLAPTLIGAAHLLYADRTGTMPEAEALTKMVMSVLGSAISKEDSDADRAQRGNSQPAGRAELRRPRDRQP
jgi:hypothetical protein